MGESNDSPTLPKEKSRTLMKSANSKTLKLKQSIRNSCSILSKPEAHVTFQSAIEYNQQSQRVLPKSSTVLDIKSPVQSEQQTQINLAEFEPLSIASQTESEEPILQTLTRQSGNLGSDFTPRSRHS